MRKETEKRPRQKSNGQKSKTTAIGSSTINIQAIGAIEVTPLQLLGIMLKCVLKDRITDEEC